MAGKTQAELDAESTARTMAVLGPILAALGGGGAKNVAGTSTTKSITKLTTASARALMQQAADDAGYIGKFSKKDITAFIAKFDAEQKKQIETIVKATKDIVIPGATEDAVTQQINNLLNTQYPSFFKPTEFATDYVWSKVNFKDEASLGGKQLIALSEARKVVADMRLLGVSDAEVQIAAKQIAKGEKTIADYTAELQRIAIKEYPHLAERFKADPTLTTRAMVSPIINMLAKNWDMDPSQITMDDPYVMSYLAPTGADGKSPPPTYADLYYKSLKDPKRDFTVAENENARQAATSLARAMGAGL